MIDTKESTYFECIQQPNNSASDNIQIVVWTPIRGGKANDKRIIDKISSSVDACYANGWLDPKIKCLFSTRKDLVSSADAILFRGRHLNESPLPPRLPHQKWIFMENEPPHKTWMFVNLTAFNGLFNMTSTFSKDSHIPISITKSCFRDWSAYDHLRGVHYAAKKRNDVPVAWFASRCYTQSRREDYVRELQKHIKVDVYGLCGDKMCGSNIQSNFKLKQDNCDQRLLHLKGSYKFYLSFENSLCEDYVTEKLWRILDLDVVPVVMGGAEYRNIMPRDSYIDVRDFNSAEDLAGYIKYLDGNDTAYNAMLRNKASLRCVDLNPRRGIGCSICQRIHETRDQVSVVHALDAFWGSRRCMTPKVYHQTRGVHDFGVNISLVKESARKGNNRSRRGL